MDDKDFFWLVGLLEGEGCFSTSNQRSKYKGRSYLYVYPKIVLRMTDRDVVERAANLLGGCGVRLVPRHRPHKDIFECELMGARALRMMRLLLPHLGIRRQARVREHLATADANAEKMLVRKGRSRRERRENPGQFVRISL